MQFVDEINPNPLASRNAADIRLTGIDASIVSIKVKRGDSVVSTFLTEPRGHVLKIGVYDILNSILQYAFTQPPTAYGDAAAEVISLEASAVSETSVTWSRTAFRAGYDGAFHTALMNSYWWTWRDQKCRTFANGKEFLGALFSSGQTQVKVTATFSDGTSSTAVLRTVTVGTSEKKFAVIDVSYNTIATLFPTKVVETYKVIRGNSAYAQEYKVSRLRPRRTFVFRNSLGLFDTVYATGVISDSATRDVKTFIGADRAENVSDNSSRERILVNSGHVDTRGQRALWDELVFSPDVWEYDAGTLRKIVIDTFDYKLQQGVSDSLTFEYHYSVASAGRGYEKSAI